MALRHIPSKSLHVSKPTWWLESRFHFSFADYFNPANVDFGALRVLNDDLVQPHAGFGTHSHRDMEIITYVLDGELTHKDSMGTSESLGRGSLQYMSAGSGVSHSEMNAGDNLLRFLQIWIKPNARGLKPNYGSRSFSKMERHNKLQQVVTSVQGDTFEDKGSGVIPIHQDASIYVSEMDPGHSIDWTIAKGRQMYLICIEGRLAVNDNPVLQARDALEAVAPASGKLPLTLKADASEGAHILLIDLPQ